MSKTTPADFAYPWIPDQRDNRYRNPVLFADYSDPDIIRVGDDYWLTASSFTDTPGLPILHSRDLVNWTIVNHAISKVPDPRYADVQPGCGVWAPAIRFHAGLFWIFFPLPDEGIFVTTAKDPRGQWSEPTLLVAGKGLIDPCPLWDDDGKAYLVHAYARSRSGIKHRLRVCPMAPDGSKLLGEGQIVFDEPEKHPTCEGPKFHKWNGYYYISAPAGGVATGWQIVLRSKNVFGPYECKVVLEQGRTSEVNGPHQGAIVDTPTGEWWFVHFQERQPYGRIVHLQPMRWKDDWPVMGEDRDENGIGEPVDSWQKPKTAAPVNVAIPQTSDDFDQAKLGLQWQWRANPGEGWYSLQARPGWLRLFGQPTKSDDLNLAPHALLQKFPALSFSTQARVELGKSPIEIALAVVGLKSAGIFLSRDGEGRGTISLRIEGKSVASVAMHCNAIDLKVNVAAGGLCKFSYRCADQTTFTTMEQTFQAVEGHWVGAKVGLICRAGEPSSEAYADVDFVRFDRADL